MRPNFKFLFLAALLAVCSFVSSYSKASDTMDIVWMKYTHDISRLEFSNDDSRILTVGTGGIIIFDAKTGSQIKQINPQKTLDGQYSKDNSLIFLVRETPDSLNNVFPFVDILDAETYEVKKTIQLPQLPIENTSKITVSPNAQIIAVSNYLGLYIIDANSGKTLKYLNQFDNEKYKFVVSSFIFSKDNLFLILSDYYDKQHGGLKYLNLQTFKVDYKNDNLGGMLTLSKDGSLLACGTSENNIAVTIINTQTHEIIHKFTGNASWICGKTFSFDGNNFAFTNLDWNTSIYKISDWTNIKTIKYACFPSLDFTKDNSYLAEGGGGQIILFKFQVSDVIEPNNKIELLYPNPTNNEITVLFELTKPTKLSYNIYDLTGKLISKLKSGFYNPGQVKENIKIGNISEGTYLLKVESLQFNKTYKIVINK